MGSYTFTLDKFHISHTRALHNDTDTVSIGVKVGNGAVQTQIKHMGDVNDGDHHVGLAIGPIEIDDAATPIVVNYQILNSGHASDAQLDSALTYGADALAAGIIGTANIWGAAGVWAVKYFADFIGADCDGAVAIDQESFTAAEIDQRLGGNETADFSKYFAGTDSPHGCGNNSKYTVTYSVSRTGPPAVHVVQPASGAHTTVGLAQAVAGVHMKSGLAQNVDAHPKVGTES